MRKTGNGLVYLASLGCALIPLAAQTSPDVLVDRHLAQAEGVIAEQNYDAALDALDSIVSLQEVHRLTLPEEFLFVRARVALSAGAAPVAVESVARYLRAAGQPGEFHAPALELRDDALAQLDATANEVAHVSPLRLIGRAGRREGADRTGPHSNAANDADRAKPRKARADGFRDRGGPGPRSDDASADPAETPRCRVLPRPRGRPWSLHHATGTRRRCGSKGK